MQASDLPPRFPIPFANNAGAGYIRTIPKDHVSPTTGDAPASLHDGFPVETFTPLGSGGIPPSGKDFNGLLNWITAAVRWAQAGAPALFDSTFCTAISGYPKGAVLASSVTAGLLWISTADNNTTDPDGGSPTNWTGLGPPIGYGQTWQNMSGSRASGTTYTNTTGRPIEVFLFFQDTGTTASASATVGGVTLFSGVYDSSDSYASRSASFIVPPGATYSSSWSGVTPVWSELR